MLESWVARYNGPANSEEYGRAVSLDSKGNVYVTGYSQSGTSFDYVTIKYDPSGVQEWVTLYAGPGNSTDYAQAIAIDEIGNVYVTGNSGVWPDFDYATIKYDSSGHQQWVARYDGPGNGYDEAYAIGVDADGNTYVTGSSDGIVSGTNDDCATIKYDPAGNQLWVARYDGSANEFDYAVALGIDGAGNVVVTGSSLVSADNADYLTIRYDSDGNELWAALYNGSASSDDYAHAITVDETGNIYVTGSSWGLGTEPDYATIRYDPDGNQQWAARYNGTGNSFDEARALAVDGSGNVYVTGATFEPGSDFDFATIKYDSSGGQQWIGRYAGPSNAEDYARALAIDANGNVYVTGYSWNSATSEDYTTIKYDSDGSVDWLTQYNGPGNYRDVAVAVALDTLGNVYVAGYSDGSGTQADYATIKYRQDFTPAPVTLLLPSDDAVVTSDSVLMLWRKSTSDPDRYWLEYASDSTFAGSTMDSTIADTFLVVSVLAHNQTYWWRVRAHNSYGWGNFSMERDFLVYKQIPGSPFLLQPDSGSTDVSVNPTFSWARSPGTEYYNLQISDTLDFSNLVVGEDSVSSETHTLMGLLPLSTYYWRVNARNSLGSSDWSLIWNFTTILPLPSEVSLVLPEDGATLNSDSVQFVWSQSYPIVDRYWLEWDDNSGFTDPAVDSMLTDTATVLRGFSNQFYHWRVKAHNGSGWGSFSDEWQFRILVTSLDEQELIPTVYTLNQNYPNPFNPSTTIRYGLPEQSYVHLDVYNLVGQKVAELVDDTRQAGWHEVVFEDKTLSSGMYFYRLKVANFVETRKLVLLQ